MLQIINHKRYVAYQQKVEALLDLFKIYHGFHLPEERRERTTYLVAEDDKRGVYGGALLYPQKNTYHTEPLPEAAENEVESISSAFQHRRKEIWTARTCLCIGDNSSPPTLELMNLCENFYKALYQELIGFQLRKRTGLLVFIIRRADMYKTLALQNWTSLYEVKLKISSEGFLCGLIDPQINNHPSEQSDKILDFSHHRGSVAG